MWIPPRRTKQLDISINSGAREAVVTLTGILDDETVTKMERAFSKIFERPPLPKEIVFVCAGLTMISSTGLAFLINAVRECHERGIEMHVSHASGQAKQAIGAIQLTRIAHRLDECYGVEVTED